jgi:hypothetical protein
VPLRSTALILSVPRRSSFEGGTPCEGDVTLDDLACVFHGQEGDELLDAQFADLLSPRAQAGAQPGLEGEPAGELLQGAGRSLPAGARAAGWPGCSCLPIAQGPCVARRQLGPPVTRLRTCAAAPVPPCCADSQPDMQQMADAARSVLESLGPADAGAGGAQPQGLDQSGPAASLVSLPHSGC